MSVPALSDKDEEDLRFALHLRCDFVALSFVRSPARRRAGARRSCGEEDVDVPVIAKLEKPEAVENLEAIVEAFDGIMVARGDLGVELPLEQVPLVQKRAIQAARERNKPVIVATQMLESMIHNSRPTRAEASDVANAVLDGADAVMLSGETSVGEYPIAAVRTMERIIDAVESDDVAGPGAASRRSRSPLRAPSCGRPRTSASPSTSRRWPPSPQTGETARRLAALHPRQPLLAFTVDARVRSQLALSWGVETFLVPPVSHTDDMVRQVDFSLLSIGRLKEGDRVVVVAGSPPNTVGLDQPDPGARGGHRLMSEPVGERPTAPLMAVLGLEEREPRRLRRADAVHPAQRIFGGQVAGQALMAAGQTVPAERARALAALLLPAAGRPAGGDPLRGRADARRPVVHHPPGGGLAAARRRRTSPSSR